MERLIEFLLLVVYLLTFSNLSHSSIVYYYNTHCIICDVSYIYTIFIIYFVPIKDGNKFNQYNEM